jgi:hypothetical protein
MAARLKVLMFLELDLESCKGEEEVALTPMFTRMQDNFSP